MLQPEMAFSRHRLPHHHAEVTQGQRQYPIGIEIIALATEVMPWQGRTRDMGL